MDEGVERWLRALTKGTMQVVPLAGGLLSEVLGQFWVAPSERKVLEMLSAFRSELERLRVSEALVLASLREREQSQALFREVVSASATSVGEQARRRLGSLLAKSISSGDSEIATTRFLLRLWLELDELEVIMLATVLAGAEERERLIALHPAVVGAEAFGGQTAEEQLERDAFYRARIDHLMRIGLIRPHDADAWANKKLRYHLDSFWPTKVAEALAWLLGIPTRFARTG